MVVLWGLAVSGEQGTPRRRPQEGPASDAADHDSGAALFVNVRVLHHFTGVPRLQENAPP
jgi:hypothetical protein